ncbi:hypothetical protein BDW60DRAFT_77406 [Aspergillus nidulans var. acristatus]
MLSVLQHEFGVHPSTFHPALEVEAWQVPELLIWRAEVALHFSVGQSAKDDRTLTVCSAIEAIRRVLEQARTGRIGAVFTPVPLTGPSLLSFRHIIRYTLAPGAPYPALLTRYPCGAQDDISQLIPHQAGFSNDQPGYIWRS